MASDVPSTSPTLLGRLRQGVADRSAWEEFVDRYGPAIFAWCRRRQLQEADARDVTQDVLVQLVRKLHAFTYDPARSFRGWLRTLTHHACSDYAAGHGRPGAGSGDTGVHRLLETVEDRDDLVKNLEAAFDRELLDEAMVRVRLRVQ